MKLWTGDFALLQRRRTRDTQLLSCSLRATVWEGHCGFLDHWSWASVPSVVEDRLMTLTECLSAHRKGQILLGNNIYKVKMGLTSIKVVEKGALIYDAQGQDFSDGPKPLATRAYYARLTQRLITALQAPMAEGRLYEVDMRLRPSGRKGPLATSLTSFANYQRSEAWTWEHLALTRARAVAGAPKLREAVERVRRELLSEVYDPVRVAQDVARMRARSNSWRHARSHKQIALWVRTA